MNHPEYLKTLVDEKLNSLRAEGMRSQEIKRSKSDTGEQESASEHISSLSPRQNAGKLKGWAFRLSRVVLIILGLG